MLFWKTTCARLTYKTSARLRWSRKSKPLRTEKVFCSNNVCCKNVCSSQRRFFEHGRIRRHLQRTVPQRSRHRVRSGRPHARTHIQHIRHEKGTFMMNTTRVNEEGWRRLLKTCFLFFFCCCRFSRTVWSTGKSSLRVGTNGSKPYVRPAVSCRVTKPSSPRSTTCTVVTFRLSAVVNRARTMRRSWPLGFFFSVNA